MSLLLLYRTPASTAVTWNPADKGADVVLSGGDLTATNAASYESVRATVSKTTGKWHFEVTATPNGGFTIGVGLCNSSASMATYLHASTNAIVYYQTGEVYYGATLITTLAGYAAGALVVVDWDADANKVWFGIDSTNDTTTGGITYAVTGALFPAATILSGAIGVAKFTGSTHVPAGYSELTGAAGTEPVPAIAASLFQIESGDQVASAASLALSATLSATEDNDTSTSAAQLAIQATLAATEANDTSSSAAALAITATLAATEANDTLASSGSEAITATLAATEANDTSTSTAALAIQATLAATEANDSLSSAATLTIQATLAATEADDSVSSAAVVAITATLAATEDNDTVSSSAGAVILASLDATEDNDTLTSDATLGVTVTDEQTGHGGGATPQQLAEFLRKQKKLPQTLLDALHRPDPPTPVAVPVKPPPEPRIGPLGPLGAVGQAAAGDDSEVLELIAALEQELADEAEDEETAIQVILGLI